MRAIHLIKGVTTVMSGESIPSLPRYEGDTNARSFQAVVEGTGAVSAVVVIEASNNGRNWLPCLTFTLTGTNEKTEAAAINSPFAYFRARVTAISGTNATVEVIEAV